VKSRHRRGDRLTRCISLAICLTALGCGEEGGATVSGKVTFKGQPVANGSVSFIAKGLPGAYARLQPDGRYTLLNHQRKERIEPGSYAVVIVINRALVGPQANKELAIPLSVTNQATTPLHYEVVEGPNTIDVNLDKLPEKPAK
jgi:hypothetical protein